MNIAVSPTLLALGQSIIGPFTVSGNTSTITVTLDRTLLPDTGSILADLWLELSSDGGASFHRFCGTGIIGGTNVFPKTGSANLTSIFSPSTPSGQQLRLRLVAYSSFTLTGLSLTTV